MMTALRLYDALEDFCCRYFGSASMSGVMDSKTSSEAWRNSLSHG